MIFVTVGQDDAGDLIPAFGDRGNIRDHQVDAEHVGLGEHQTAVDDQQAACRLDDHHVQADFTEPAQRQNTHGIRMQWP